MIATEPGAATTTVSEEVEAGTSARVRTRKQDKYRSEVALEMVMAERLAEQAVEMCLADLPAELGAVNVASLLAELKTPPGLAPVRAKAASESAAASEIGVGKARIEANRDDAQSDEGREDKMQNVDSGGEKRSQV
jgi:hypothetical protein